MGIFHRIRTKNFTISIKIDFKIKTVTRDKGGHYIMTKGSIQEDVTIVEGIITIVNIYAPKKGAPLYIKQMLTAIKGEIDSNTILVGDFNTPLSPMDGSSKMKINKETQALNDTLKKWTSLIFIGHTIQKQQNTLSFQVLMEYFPG